MAIDAVIERVRETDAGLRLELAPRTDASGQDSIPGRPALTILGERTFSPQVGQEIWGGSHSCLIVDGAEYDRRGVSLHETRNCPRCFCQMHWVTVTNTHTGAHREVRRCRECGTEAAL